MIRTKLITSASGSLRSARLPPLLSWLSSIVWQPAQARSKIALPLAFAVALEEPCRLPQPVTISASSASATKSAGLAHVVGVAERVAAGLWPDAQAVGPGADGDAGKEPAGVG